MGLFVRVLHSGRLFVAVFGCFVPLGGCFALGGGSFEPPGVRLGRAVLFSRVGASGGRRWGAVAFESRLSVSSGGRARSEDVREPALVVGTIVRSVRCLGLRYSGDTVSGSRGAVDAVARACDLVDDDLDFSLWRGPAGPKASIVRGGGHRPGRAVRRAALGARRRLAHLGQDRGCPISTIPRRGGGRRPVRRAPGRVSTGAGSTHWGAMTDSRENARTASHRDQGLGQIIISGPPAVGTLRAQ